MPSVADCLRQHQEAFLRQSADRLSLQQRKVLSAVTRCRTGQLGHVIFECQSCGHTHWVGRSCGNRHCPTCQHQKTQQWLLKQTERLLPVQHFLVTFTVSDELRSLLRACPNDGYDAIFQAGAGTIRTLLENPKWLGSPQVGFFGVLHTWGRDPMVFHPHVHFIVPGGGVSEDGTKWLATPANFLFPEAVASIVYRQKFREALRAAGLESNVDPSVWHRWWEVSVQPVGDGRAVLKYLAPYVYRVAISDNRIVECTEQGVTYHWTPSGTNKIRTRTVTGQQFVGAFLQHVLPKGFRKVRHYGWMASNSQTTRDRVRWLVWLFLGWTYWLASGVAPQPERFPVRFPECSRCGGALHLLAITDASGRVVAGSLPVPPPVLASHPTEYLDSG